MWEAYGMENEDFLWASTCLQGGLGGFRKGACGAIASSAVCLGLHHRQELSDKEATEKAREKARNLTKELAESFHKEYGDVICENLADFGPPGQKPDPEKRKAAIEGKCIYYVQYAVSKLYEFEGRE